VEPGAVLRDVLEHDLAPAVRLNQCHRQAGVLKHNCNRILEGVVEPSALEGDPLPWMVHKGLATPERVVQAITKLFEEYLPTWGYDPIEDTQFLTAMHKGALGTKYLNKVCQRLRQKQLGNELPEPKVGEEERAVLMVGDRCIQNKNDYELDVMNGNQGVIENVAGGLVVNFGDREVEYPNDKKGNVELSYVVTPHRYQGSEIPCVVGIVHSKHSFMMHRNWLYTLCTRAKKTCVLIGDENGISRAAERVDDTRRTTLLQLFAKNQRGK
jgi:exodeoxyribonuclease V alpha subunit